MHLCTTNKAPDHDNMYTLTPRCPAVHLVLGSIFSRVMCTAAGLTDY